MVVMMVVVVVPSFVPKLHRYKPSKNESQLLHAQVEEMIEFGEAIAEEIATVEIPAPVRVCILLGCLLAVVCMFLLGLVGGWFGGVGVWGLLRKEVRMVGK